MKMHKTILTLLAMTLAVIGTTTTVVHADEPETPPKTMKTTPVVDQNIDDEAFLSYTEAEVSEGRLTTAVTRYNALPASGKAVLIEAWGQIQTQTPAKFLSDHTDWLINVISQYDYTNQSCCFITDLFATAGYSSALSGMPGGSSYLSARVATQGHFASNACGNGCMAVTAQVSAPNGSGNWKVESWHTSVTPPGGAQHVKIVSIP